MYVSVVKHIQIESLANNVRKEHDEFQLQPWRTNVASFDEYQGHGQNLKQVHQNFIKSFNIDDITLTS